MDKRVRNLKIAGVCVSAAVIALFTVLAARWVLSLRDPERLAEFQGLIASLGSGGWFVLLGIQIVQIVIAFIPGGPIQMVAGALYGPVWGLLICVIGTILATAAVFSLVSRYGSRVISLFVDEKDILRYDFLHSQEKLEKLILILFFIPGTPKDALTYLIALTPIPPGRFLLLATTARLPAMVTSVLAGDSIVDGEWLRALCLFAVITVIAAVGLLLHGRIMRMYAKHKK